MSSKRFSLGLGVTDPLGLEYVMWLKKKGRLSKDKLDSDVTWGRGSYWLLYERRGFFTRTVRNFGTRNAYKIEKNLVNSCRAWKVPYSCRFMPYQVEKDCLAQKLLEGKTFVIIYAYFDGGQNSCTYPKMSTFLIPGCYEWVQLYGKGN